MFQQTRHQLLVLFGLGLLATLMKVIPHALSVFGLDTEPGTSIYPWNFSPLLPVGLFAGAMAKSKRFAIVLPMVSMLVADALIAILRQDTSWLFYMSAPFSYAAVGLSAVLGSMIPKRRPVWAIATAGGASAVAFFLITNFAAWALPHYGVYMYPLTFAGLVECYVAALPFYKNTVIGFAIYLPLLFSPVMTSFFELEESIASSATETVAH